MPPAKGGIRSNGNGARHDAEVQPRFCIDPTARNRGAGRRARGNGELPVLAARLVVAVEERNKQSHAADSAKKANAFGEVRGTRRGEEESSDGEGEDETPDREAGQIAERQKQPRRTPRAEPAPTTTTRSIATPPEHNQCSSDDEGVENDHPEKYRGRIDGFR